MAHQIIAPWGEIVLGAGPMTADELLAMGDAARNCELVDGVLVKMSPTSWDHGSIVGNMSGALWQYVTQKRLGRILGAETGFILSQPDQPETVLAPDVAFVQTSRIPQGQDMSKFQRVAPDLAVEVVSPDQYKPEMGAKARLYLEAGVRLVWVVWPGTRTVDVWRPGSDAPAAMLTINDSLDGLDVLPGFSYPLADLFS